jgi:DNA topoisomerase III
MKYRKLFICEKPSQGRDVANVIGCKKNEDGFLSSDTAIVTWCFGHLLETASPDFYCENIKPWKIEKLPIIPTNWKMEIKKESSKQANTIKKQLKECGEVIIATDADREGEVIARELLEFYNFKGKISRLWLSALDEVSIKNALDNLKSDESTKNLYFSGLGRQRADWLIGMNITMAASALHSKFGEGVLSVGRVQTPTLKLVVDRENEIQKFKSKEYYELEANFNSKNTELIKTKWQPKEELLDHDNKIVNKEIINKVILDISNQISEVTEYHEKIKNTSAPLCFSLSQLQKLASSRFNYSAKETLEIAQSLYETHKAITYPRTDCQYLPNSQFHEAKQILNNLSSTLPSLSNHIKECDLEYRSSIWDDEKITAHHAIIPTNNKNINISRMNEKERNLYEIVCRYFIAQFLGKYEYKEIHIGILVKDESFKTTLHFSIKRNWKNILQSIEEDSTTIEMLLAPSIKKGDMINLINTEILTKQTKSSPRFSEGTLIEAMKNIGKYVTDEKVKKKLKETSGIGTEATRASIIDTLFKRGYIEKTGKQIIPTDKGKKLITLLPPVVSDPALTAIWEQELDEIAGGKGNLIAFVDKQKEVVYDILSKLIPSHLVSTSCHNKHSEQQTEAFSCPLCSKHLVLRTASSSKNKFWGCISFPTCRFTANDQNGTPFFKSQGA